MKFHDTIYGSVLGGYMAIGVEGVVFSEIGIGCVESFGVGVKRDAFDTACVVIPMCLDVVTPVYSDVVFISNPHSPRFAA